MKQKLKIGLLPLYLKMYDDVLPENRKRVDAFHKTISGVLEDRGMEVVTSAVCRFKYEFVQAVKKFESEMVSAIVTLHLAYSPSLESAEVLSSTDIPLVVFDTTPTADFSPHQDPDEIMYNHGIHGVQDMCNLLLRNNKKFFIAAGHWEDEETIKELVRKIETAHMVFTMRNATIGLIGEPFPGMGDFSISASDLHRDIGPTVVQLDLQEFYHSIENISSDDIIAERNFDNKRFDCRDISSEVMNHSIRVGLAIRNWIEKNKLNGISFNFQDFTRNNGFDTVPFLEASKQMASGRGYAGEGDCLTASLISAVICVYPETSFTEMFCPDWKGNTIFLSHMGEINFTLLSGTPKLVEMDYSFSDTGNPVYIPGRFKAGGIVLFDLAPIKDGYRLILSNAVMTENDGIDNFQNNVRGWFKPNQPIRKFLTKYSKAGGTHHIGISYTAPIEVLEDFGKMMGWEVIKID